MNARRLTACWLLLAACGGGAPAADAPKPVSSGGASSGADPASGGPAWPVQIACGDFHTCALMSDKTVRCWGRNQGGELKLLNLTKKVHDLLQITKLYTVFDVKDDEAVAVSSFK